MRRTVTPAGSFAVYLSPHSSDVLLSLAVPVPPDPADWGPSIAALRDAYRGHGACPRLEFFAELHTPPWPAPSKRTASPTTWSPQ